MTAETTEPQTADIRHPLARWPRRNRRQVVIGLAVLFVIFSAVLAVAGRDLRTDEAPWGIVSLQLADGERSAEILAEWDRDDVLDQARFSLWFDFLYLLTYAPLLALGVVGVARRLERKGWLGLVALGALVAWGALLAGALDAAEDFALLQLISDPTSEGLAQAATIFASLKFALIGAALLYLLAGLLPTRSAALVNDRGR